MIDLTTQTTAEEAIMVERQIKQLDVSISELSEEEETKEIPILDFK
jgi:hypothetical protein